MSSSFHSYPALTSRSRQGSDGSISSVFSYESGISNPCDARKLSLEEQELAFIEVLTGNSVTWNDIHDSISYAGSEDNPFRGEKMIVNQDKELPSLPSDKLFPPLYSHKRVNNNSLPITRGTMRKNSEELHKRKLHKGKHDSYYETVIKSYFEF
jgi:hypothetical protein